MSRTDPRTATPLPLDARAIGEEILARMCELDYLNSPERREESGQYRETRAADDVRASILAASIDRLTRIAQVAATLEHTDALRSEK